jgi:hypothetical protein
MQFPVDYTFLQHLRGGIYAEFFWNEPSILMKNVPLWTQLQLYCQHDRVPTDI